MTANVRASKHRLKGLLTLTVVALLTARTIAVVAALFGRLRLCGACAGAGVHVADLVSRTLLVAGTRGGTGAVVADLVASALGIGAALNIGVGLAVTM